MCGVPVRDKGVWPGIACAALIAFACLPASALPYSQNRWIRDVEFTGNMRVPASRLLASISSLPGTPYSEERLARDLDALRECYLHEGFCFAEARCDSVAWSADSLEATPFFSIWEGEQLLIGEITFDGNLAFPGDELMQGMETRTGSVLDGPTLEKDLRSIVARYGRNGFPFAGTSVRSVTLLPGTPSRIAVGIGIAEGARVALHDIRIAGNTETSDHVIIRETRITENELFDEEKVAKIPQRLRRMNIFSSVREPQVFVNEAGGGLLIEVAEGTTNTFDGILGYVPAAAGQSQGYVTGMVNVGMRNLFGTARRLQIHWLKDDSYSQEVSAQYTEPWVFDLPLNLSGGFFQRQQDSSYVHRTIDLRAEIPFFDAGSVTATLHREDIIPSGSLVVVTVGRSKSLLAGLELLYDTRDDMVSPTGGERFRATYQTGTKNIATQPTVAVPLPGKSTVQKIGVDAEFFFETLSKQIGAIAMHGRQITSDNLEPGDYYRFGGATTLRGYRENQLQGSAVAWTAAEYRFLLAPRSFVYGFFDTGFYFIAGDAPRGVGSAQDFLFGYGVGFRLDTVLGNIGVSIALGKGDPPSQAKLHFALINDF